MDHHDDGMLDNNNNNNNNNDNNNNAILSSSSDGEDDIGFVGHADPGKKDIEDHDADVHHGINSYSGSGSFSVRNNMMDEEQKDDVDKKKKTATDGGFVDGSNAAGNPDSTRTNSTLAMSADSSGRAGGDDSHHLSAASLVRESGGSWFYYLTALINGQRERRRRRRRSSQQRRTGAGVNAREEDQEHNDADVNNRNDVDIDEMEGVGGGPIEPDDNTTRQRSKLVDLLERFLPFSARWRRRIRIMIQYGLLFLLCIILVLWIGAEYQDAQVRKAPDTLYLYETDEVCALKVPVGYNTTTTATISSNDTHVITASTGIDLVEGDYAVNPTSSDTAATAPLLPPITSETASSLEEILESNDQDYGDNPQNSTVATHDIPIHCGACGQCSNPHDIAIYDETKNSLFETTLECGTRGLIWGRKTASSCMMDDAGFTSGCNDCWVENIMCDIRRCLFTCIWYGLFSEVDKSAANKKLNRCTICDEKLCGPEFVKCAGANRRRTGILSDIERDFEDEVCTAVQDDWWKDEHLQDYYQEQQEQLDDDDDDDGEDDGENDGESISFVSAVGVGDSGKLRKSRSRTR